MELLSTQVNHLIVPGYSRSISIYHTICKCPSGVVWEIHNLFTWKVGGAWGGITRLIIDRGGVLNILERNYDIGLGEQFTNVNRMFYMGPGDVLILEIESWTTFVLYQISWGVVEHRDPK